MNTTEITAPKIRTVTLTGRPPVKIREDAWPIIAQGRDSVEWRGAPGGTPLPSYEQAHWWLIARQHADRRTLVYGVAEAPQGGWPSHGATDWRGGVLLGQGDPQTGAGYGEVRIEEIVEAIQSVGADLVEHGGAPESIVRECIADLPAEAI